VLDSMRYLITRIGSKEEMPGCISLVSSLRGEGVTYLSRALAATIVHDLKVSACVVDLNWWWPSPLPGDEDNPGLAGVVMDSAVLEDVVVETGMSGFSLLPAGKLSKENRPVVARSQKLKETIAELNWRYNFVILDIPAIMAANDAVPLAALGSTCCVVLQQGATHIEDLRLALDEIAHLKISGVVMNRVTHHTPARLIKLISSL
jgi:tyrosine-protein kinase Etk/Wzc